VREVARRFDGGLTLLADTGRTWARLKDLFTIIDGGSPQLGVDTFNGGLFDPRRHPFLERFTVGDAQLQRALDKLARVYQLFDLSADEIQLIEASTRYRYGEV
jgi:hypothetical protein